MGRELPDGAREQLDWLAEVGDPLKIGPQSKDDFTCPKCGMNRLAYEKCRADSKRLDKLERAMRQGNSIDAYGFDDEKNEWGRMGIGILFKDSDEDEWSGADLLADTLREAIDKLEEQDND